VHDSRYVQVLHSPILAALLHGTPAAGVSQTLRRGTSYGITELSQRARAPPVFGWAAITLGIDPHSSIAYMSIVSLCNKAFLAFGIIHSTSLPYTGQYSSTRFFARIPVLEPLNLHASTYL